jgi:hypothetical protein
MIFCFDDHQDLSPSSPAVASTAQASLDPRAGNSVIVPRPENASSQCGTGQLLAR